MQNEFYLYHGLPPLIISNGTRKTKEILLHALQSTFIEFQFNTPTALKVSLGTIHHQNAEQNKNIVV